MTAALKILRAEALKQQRRMSGSKLVFFSMVLWPLLEIAVAYYTVRPVSFSAQERWAVGATPGGLLAFLATGTLAYSFFYSLVQSAWHFTFERQTGTLELLFLSPANRLVLVTANGAGALVQNAWLFLCFSGALLLLSGSVHLAYPGILLVVFLALLVPAVAWGALLNSIMIFSRDASYLFELFGEPMRFVTGVQVPTFALPTVAAAIGSLLPLTTSLVVVRGALLDGATLTDLLPRLGLLALVSALLFGLAALALAYGEWRVRRSGRLRFF